MGLLHHLSFYHNFSYPIVVLIHSEYEHTLPYMEKSVDINAIWLDITLNPKSWREMILINEGPS